MNPSVTFRPRARMDLLEQFLYLADQATAEVAERYFTAVDQTCALVDPIGHGVGALSKTAVAPRPLYASLVRRRNQGTS